MHAPSPSELMALVHTDLDSATLGGLEQVATFAYTSVPRRVNGVNLLFVESLSGQHQHIESIEDWNVTVPYVSLTPAEGSCMTSHAD